MSRKLITVLSVALFALTGCGRDMSGSTYTDGATSGKVVSGVVISARPVKIKANDKLGNNGTGAMMGAAAGGVGGYQMGNGRGNTAATVGGALAGAVIGALAEDALSTSEGMEYLVKIDGKHGRTGDSQTKKTHKSYGVASPSNDIESSIDTQMQTDVIAVVQKAEPGVGAGSRVYVVYSDDRPRIVPAQ
ncbi:MAG: glycine zipper 2TM domain-containing protein [Alphaproteobacteria bacterium]|nr:glycine zipper 2TM domain-containing protein [Alphaproteobacteria bacterium]